MTVSRETGPPAEGSGEEAQAASVSRETGEKRAPGPLTRIALAPILIYRKLISPLLAPRCRYYPTCSAYAEDAVRTLGPLRGTIVAVWRVLRCNPLSSGGLDPIENRRLFRSAATGGAPDSEPESSETYR